MSWFRNFFGNLFGKKRGKSWEPFRQVDDIIVDKPEDFRNLNNS